MSPIMIDDEREPREPGCSCHAETGDSPCGVHDLEEQMDALLADEIGGGAASVHMDEIDDTASETASIFGPRNPDFEAYAARVNAAGADFARGEEWPSRDDAELAEEARRDLPAPRARRPAPLPAEPTLAQRIEEACHRAQDAIGPGCLRASLHYVVPGGTVAALFAAVRWDASPWPARLIAGIDGSDMADGSIGGVSLLISEAP